MSTSPSPPVVPSVSGLQFLFLSSRVGGVGVGVGVPFFLLSSVKNFVCFENTRFCQKEFLDEIRLLLLKNVS